MRKIESAREVYDVIGYVLEDEPKKRVVSIYLKEDGTLLGWNDQTENNAMLSLASVVGAKKVILVTNHPNGNSLPEQEDIEHTIEIRELLGTLNIGLIDHIIIGYKEFYSYAEEKITFVK